MGKEDQSTDKPSIAQLTSVETNSKDDVVGGGDAIPEAIKPGSTEFAGYGKAELQKLAKDPFWVKVRWILFILFWIVWFGLFIGAILLIVLSKKC